MFHSISSGLLVVVRLLVAGIQGPVIVAQAGDRVVVHFKNLASQPYSISPVGITYGKQSEGCCLLIWEKAQSKSIISILWVHILRSLTVIFTSFIICVKQIRKSNVDEISHLTCFEIKLGSSRTFKQPRGCRRLIHFVNPKQSLPVKVFLWRIES